MADPQDPFRQGVSMAARVGVELAVTILVGALLGYGLDRWLSTRPWLMLAGLIVGTVAAFRNLYRALGPPVSNSKKGNDGKSA